MREVTYMPVRKGTPIQILAQKYKYPSIVLREVYDRYRKTMSHEEAMKKVEQAILKRTEKE